MNMTKFLFLCSAATLLLGIVSCDAGAGEKATGSGTLSLGLSSNPSYTSKTRSINEAEYKEVNNYAILISDAEGVAAYNGLYKDMPMSIELSAGKPYTVKACYGENPDAAFDKMYVEGIQQFTLKDGEQMNLSLTCRPANVKVSVVYTEDFMKYYSDCTVSLKTARLMKPFTMNLVTDAGKDAFLKADAAGEELSITVDGFKDKKGNPVTMDVPLCSTKTITPRMYLTITVESELITISSGTASLDVTVNPDTEDKDVNIEIPEEYWPGNAGK